MVLICLISTENVSIIVVATVIDYEQIMTLPYIVYRETIIIHSEENLEPCGFCTCTFRSVIDLCE